MWKIITLKLNKQRMRLDYYKQFFNQKTGKMLFYLLLLMAIFLNSYILIKNKIRMNVIVRFLVNIFRKFVLQNVPVSSSSEYLKSITVIYEIGIFFMIIYICNTIGTQIVVVRDENINSLKELIEKEDTIESYYGYEDGSSQEISRFNMKNLKERSFYEISNMFPKNLTKMAILTSQTQFISAAISKKLNSTTKLHISKKNVKTVSMAAASSKCSRW